MNNIFYELYHVYDNEELEEVSKFIGAFSSFKKIDKTIKLLMDQPGFNKFSKENFIVSKSKLNEYEWKEGFCSWGDAYEYQISEE